jgi:hypothetical protein
VINAEKGKVIFLRGKNQSDTNIITTKYCNKSRISITKLAVSLCILGGGGGGGSDMFEYKKIHLHKNPVCNP